MYHVDMALDNITTDNFMYTCYKKIFFYRACQSIFLSKLHKLYEIRQNYKTNIHIVGENLEFLN